MNVKTLGEKIKKLRKKKKLTQSELVGKKITRNMLSCIENGTATPSLDTLQYIADSLSVPTAYLISEDDDLLSFEKKEKISKIYRAFEAKSYKDCVNLINRLSGTDDELNYLLAVSYAELGKKETLNGSLLSALKYLEQATDCCSKTKIPTEHLTAQILMYTAIAKNVQSPLLEFDSQRYENSLMRTVEFEFFKYLTQDLNYAYKIGIYKLHTEAKILMKERNYTDAIQKLLQASELSKNESYNAFVIFSIYNDLEYCYKQLYNYEKAYLYSTKRITLIESFKT